MGIGEATPYDILAVLNGSQVRLLCGPNVEAQRKQIQEMILKVTDQPIEILTLSDYETLTPYFLLRKLDMKTVQPYSVLEEQAKKCQDQHPNSNES